MTESEIYVSSEMIKFIVQAQKNMAETLKAVSYPLESMKQMANAVNAMTKPMLENFQRIAQYELEMRKQLASIVAATRISEHIRIITENKIITDLFKEGRIKYPYPYSKNTFRKLAFNELKEEEIVQDLFKKITDGKVMKILNEHNFFNIEELCDIEAKELLKEILTKLTNNQEKDLYKFIWFFPIAENVANKYIEADADYIIHSLTEFSKNAKTQQEKKDIKRIIKDIKRIRKATSKEKGTKKGLMLGGFTKAMSKAVMMFPVTDVLYPFLILEEAKNIRNDFMHGSIFTVTQEHVVIALSFLITIINFHLKMYELDPIILELES